MAVNVKNVSEVFSKDVFTARGDYYGKITDVKVDLVKFRLKSLVIEAARGSPLAQSLGGKRGIVVPYQMVQSVGDIVIIKPIANQLLGSGEEKDEKAAATY
ncbi:MAG: PRC-barrel domain-containing protein [Candidatus Aenigmatarchaeota archaeon]|nr:MAG: PRC-barrel domain-containing protein [Candidatus Aenigmarchaeota archaeon]